MEKLKPKFWLKKSVRKRPILRLRRGDKKEIITSTVGK
jgi:hypothetical protein